LYLTKINIETYKNQCLKETIQDPKTINLQQIFNKIFTDHILLYPEHADDQEFVLGCKRLLDDTISYVEKAMEYFTANHTIDKAVRKNLLKIKSIMLGNKDCKNRFSAYINHLIKTK